MEVGIKIGDYDVLSSGSVIAIENVPIQFSIYDLKISFLFESESEGEKGMNIRLHIVSDKEAEYTFVNYDAQLGCGLVRPIHVGTINGRDLSVMARFSQLNIGGKLIHYTWLLRDLEAPQVATDNKENDNPLETPVPSADAQMNESKTEEGA